jgi:hypothetical protein
MRQYELVERVRRYNPHADEILLNKAYVYAMRAHGAQKRASGDPYFTHPLEVAAILTIGIEELTKGYAMRRLVRRGVPIRTPTFEVERHLIWGATARILTDLLRRIGAL